MKLKYFGILMLPAMALALASCSGKDDKKDAADKTDEIPAVKVATVSMRDVEQKFTYTATTEAEKVNNISSSMPLRIKQILVDEGQFVGAGQRLVILDDVNTDNYQLQVGSAEAQVTSASAAVSSAQAQLGSAEAAYRNAQIEFNRATELYKIGGGTKQQLDAMETQLINARNAVASAREGVRSAQSGVSSAQNGVASAKRSLQNAGENSVLTSPVSGVVTARNYDPGDMTGNLPILTISQVQPIKVVINVSETSESMARRE